jgi:organic hydroperoxide reductase OsmC/OhrA
MSEHQATIVWNREGKDFGYKTYSRDHVWRFENGIEVPASAAPAYFGNPQRVDPEGALVAALSSCHMLTFLAVCARKRLVVDSYDDEAVGYLEKNAEGKLAMTRVVLRPRVRFGGDGPPSDEEFAKLHDKAHHACFIANSVRTEVTVEPVAAQDR